MTATSRPSNTTDLITVQSVADLAYERIRSLILSGEVPPAMKLGQVELAERFGISRTPVREALRRLAGEGLVEPLANRGFRVADLGLEDRKSTRLNSSHANISYAVFCLKKKKKK